MSKFDGVTDDEDTAVLYSTETKFGEYDVLYQSWIWSGIEAQSLIFVTKELESKTESELIEDVRNSPLVEDKKAEITYKVVEPYTFVNFNFVTKD